MTRRKKALDVALVICGAVLIGLSLQGGSGSGFVSAIGVGLIVGSGSRLLGATPPKFDPSKSGIQQWRERRRSK